MTVVTVELEDDMLEQARRYAEKKQLGLSDLFTSSLKKFLVLAELSDLQTRLDGKAAELGFETEDDLLNAVS